MRQLAFHGNWRWTPGPTFTNEFNCKVRDRCNLSIGGSLFDDGRNFHAALDQIPRCFFFEVYHFVIASA